MKICSISLLFLIVFLALWGLNARDSLVFPSLGAVLEVFIKLLGDGVLPSATLNSLLRFFIGLLLGGSLAVFFFIHRRAIFSASRVIVMSCGKISAEFPIDMDKSDTFSLEFLVLKREFAYHLKTHRFDHKYTI